MASGRLPNDASGWRRWVAYPGKYSTVTIDYANGGRVNVTVRLQRALSLALDLQKIIAQCDVYAYTGG